LAWADYAIRDFRAKAPPVSSDDAAAALALADPGAHLVRGGGTFISPEGAAIRFDVARAGEGAAALPGATIYDMFAQNPLDFDLEARKTLWTHPGRARNEAFFYAMHGDSAAEVQSNLTAITCRGQTATATFQMTTRNCVAVQLQAALVRWPLSRPPMTPLSPTRAAASTGG